MSETAVEGIKPAEPTRALIGKSILALAISSVGGALFAFVGTPLPFMLGAVAFSAVAAIVGLPVKSPKVLRPFMAAVIGAMLGSTFSAEVISDVGRWIVPILGLVVFLVACGAASVTYLRKVAGFDPQTAYFAGMPGGLMEMVMLGSSLGGDVRKIAIIHATRIMVIVFTIPVVIRYVADVDIPSIRPGSVSVLETGPIFYLWFVGTCLAGVAIAHIVRLPAKYLLGPMFASAFVHIMGWSDYLMPFELVIVAQIALGATIGCRFVGLTFRDIGTLAVAGLGSTAILIAVTAVFAFALGPLMGLGPISLVLAYSPGGIVEMGLVALAVGIDTAFVAVHHLVRIIMVSMSAPIVFRLLGLGRKGETEIASQP